MFDKLIDFLIEMIDKLMPVFIINQFDAGILLRRGIFKTFLNIPLRNKIQKGCERWHTFQDSISG